MGIDLEGSKARIRTAVDGLRGQLLATSHDIHANPDGEVAGRETWLARGREYAGGRTVAE